MAYTSGRSTSRQAAREEERAYLEARRSRKAPAKSTAKVTAKPAAKAAAKTPAKSVARAPASATATKKPKTPTTTKKSRIGPDGMTDFARKHFIGGSADQASRAATGFSAASWAKMNPSTRKRVLDLVAANKRIRTEKAAGTYKGRG